MPARAKKKLVARDKAGKEKNCSGQESAKAAAAYGVVLGGICISFSHILHHLRKKNSCFRNQLPQFPVALELELKSYNMLIIFRPCLSQFQTQYNDKTNVRRKKEKGYKALS